jgi:hypothetical protein
VEWILGNLTLKSIEPLALAISQLDVNQRGNAGNVLSGNIYEQFSI